MMTNRIKRNLFPHHLFCFLFFLSAFPVHLFAQDETAQTQLYALRALLGIAASAFFLLAIIFVRMTLNQKKIIVGLQDEIKKFSFKDDLTKVYNYRYFQERLQAELKAAKRSLDSLTLMLIDIDYFKSINVSYGHVFGDFVLAEFAELIRKNVRENDVVFKHGDDEFGVILPATASTQAQALANRIQEIVHGHLFKYEFSNVHVKVSIGFVSYPDDG